MPHLLLINPSNSIKGLGNMSSTAFPPLNLPYIAALTPPHYKIEVIDENIEIFQYRDADIVGITAYTASANRAYEISQIYRQKGIPTVMGGIHVSMLPDEASNYCDVVAIGEAETIWPEILKDFERNELKPRYKGGWIDLNELPAPRRDILNNDYYEWGSIQTSRGCPMNCSFCSVTAFNGRQFRRRPLESVIEELETIPQKKILITDDNIIGYGEKDKAWLLSFFERIIEKKIKKYFFAQASIQFGQDIQLLRIAEKAGLKIVFIGIESITPDSLKSYSKNVNLKFLLQNGYKNLLKNIRKAGILLLGAFILGGDEEDISIFNNTLKFIKKAKIDIIQICKLTPLPGTVVWDNLSKDNRIFKQDFPKAWDDFRFTTIHFKPAKMTVEEIYEGFAFLKKSYFSLHTTLMRTLSTLISTKSILNTIVAFKLNQSYKKAFKNSENFYYSLKQDLDKKYKI
jgi:radical SAM superfamily enzyme YgiQ (UPF0313 family)